MSRTRSGQTIASNPREEDIVKVIGIKTDSHAHGVFVLESLKTAVQEGRVALDDIALVSHDEEGKLQIEQTGDVTTRRGAKRGTLVGALVGLAAPPLLGAAVVGAGLGALWGKFRDRGVDDDLMKRVGGMLTDGQAVVFAMGTDAAIDAVAAKVREVTGGEMETFVLHEGHEALVQEAAEEIGTGLEARESYGIRSV
jgi:uncharacterized membrane protein